MKIGSKLVCINDKGWWGTIGTVVFKGKGPKYNEVVTYNGDCPDVRGNILLEEYMICNGAEASWDKREFVPVIDSNISIEIVEEVPDLVPVLV